MCAGHPHQQIVNEHLNFPNAGTTDQVNNYEVKTLLLLIYASLALEATLQLKLWQSFVDSQATICAKPFF